MNTYTAERRRSVQNAAAATVVIALVGYDSAIVGPATGQNLRESDFRDWLCAGMRTEVRLERQSIADCVSATHAIEIDWADKWKEGVGQALTYSAETDLIPGLVLICRKAEEHCLASSLYAQETFSAYGIEATVWECNLEDRSLSTCVERWVCRGGGC